MSISKLELPVLMVHDLGGGWTAISLDNNSAKGFGKSAIKAQKELARILKSQSQENHGIYSSNFLNPKIGFVQVDVRTQYPFNSWLHLNTYNPTQARRIDKIQPQSNLWLYPTFKETTVKVPYVKGVSPKGEKIAQLPFFEVCFLYQTEHDLKKFAEEYALLHLGQMTNAQFLRFLIPSELSLDTITLPRAVLEKQSPEISMLQTRKTSPAIRPPKNLLEIAEELHEQGLNRRYSRAYERDKELNTLVEKLQGGNRNIILLGESGVGKTSLLIDAVEKLKKITSTADQSSNESKGNRRFWMTSGSKLIAGMKFLGQWEKRTEKLISELSHLNGVLCIEKLSELVLLGGEGPTGSIASFLMPYLARKELFLIGEATPIELDSMRRLLPNFVEFFEIVSVPNFTRDQTLKVLDRLLNDAKIKRKIEIKQGVSEKIFELFQRFQPYATFPKVGSSFINTLIQKKARYSSDPPSPEQAVKISKNRRVLPDIFQNSENFLSIADVFQWINQAFSEQPEIQKKARRSYASLSPEDVVKAFQERTGLPDVFLRNEIPLPKEEVIQWFSQRIIDQPEGVAAATRAVLTFKAGLNDPNRPLAVLLLCGPTGVGKTALAKCLAEYFFGAGAPSKNKSRLIRLDMSEYQGFDAVSRLIGPTGGDPSPFIQKIRQQPFTVILLDEIEKASPEVFDVLLNVFDEGRLTDSLGRITEFRSSLIIMTSNLGADRQQNYGFDPLPIGPRYSDLAMQFFRPEFFNRIDEVVTFYPLKAQSIEAITRKELEEIRNREGIIHAGLKLKFTDRLVKHLAQTGFDPRYGARPLQRTIENEVVVPLASWLIKEANSPKANVLLDWDQHIMIQWETL